ncbi:nucleotidyltransferase family protein [Pseudomonas bharatica]|uniref:nucleotidyltransferase family protein n=1 Tax=Pseudomonas TaxID=286 RepID=UPI003B27BEEB
MGSKGLTGRCAALVLAAGRGRRFGSDKRIAPLPGGARLLETTLARVLEAFEDVWVVLRPEDDVAALGVDAGRVKVVRAERADEGMGRSLAAGARAIAQSGSGIEAVAVMLGDMPWVKVQTLVQLAGLAKEDRILVPRFEEQRGHPVVFGKAFWEELAGLDGDQGGRRVIEQHQEACRNVEVGDQGVIADVDLPPDCRG